MEKSFLANADVEVARARGGRPFGSSRPHSIGPSPYASNLQYVRATKLFSADSYTPYALNVLSPLQRRVAVDGHECLHDLESGVQFNKMWHQAGRGLRVRGHHAHTHARSLVVDTRQFLHVEILRRVSMPNC